MATFNVKACDMWITYSKEMKAIVEAMTDAAMYGETAKVQEFLAAGVDVNAVDRAGWSALDWACGEGDGDIVRLLLDHDANANQVDMNGLSALGLACAYGYGDIVRLLLDHGANVNHVTPFGDTPLHRACKYYNPSEQNQIDVCIILIENGADTSIHNKDGLTPIDVLGKGGYDIDADEAKPIKRALERQEYSKLEKGSKPVTVKLFLLGDSAAGKTTVRRALLMKDTPQDNPHDPTPGIDVGTYDIHGVGKLSIWDAAGQIEYHITHGMFLGNENAVVVVVYDLQEGQKAQEKLDYWMKFLKCGNPAATKSKLKIIILASHLDKIPNERTARMVAGSNLRAIKRDFDEAFEIADTVLMVNARLCQSEGMSGLRRVLKDTFEKIQGSRTLPTLCEKILERKAEWVTTKSPILPYEEYKEKVREIHHLVTDDFIRISANYLRDMGEIFLAQKCSNQGHVVLDTRWLSYSIIGPTFAGSEFEGGLKRLKKKPYYTQEELEDYYYEIADFPTLALLLQGLELMVTLKEGQYIIPAKLAEFEGKPTSELKNGRSIYCIDKTMFAPILFTAIQGRIMNDPSFKGNQPLVSSDYLEFTMDTEGLVWQMNKKSAISIALKDVAENKEACYKRLEEINKIIMLALSELSPGTKVATGYLSPHSLKESEDLKVVAFYTMEEIEDAEEGDGYVSTNIQVAKKEVQIREKTSDILIAGADPHFIRVKGIHCNYNWMLEKKKKKLLSAMDKTNSLRTDYRSLSELLQIDESECLQNTDDIIKYWCKTGKKMTLGILLTLFKHPGLVGNDKAANIIEEMLKEIGHKFMTGAEGIVWQMNKKAAISLAVKDVTEYREACHKRLEEVNKLMVQAHKELSSGTDVETAYLNPHNLQERKDLKAVAFYTMQEIENSYTRYVTAEVMIAGANPHFIRMVSKLTHTSHPIKHKILVPFEVGDVQKVIGFKGLPDDAVLLWRAVLRKSHEELLRNINPSKLTGLSSILSARDEYEINRQESPLEAVDLLISKLIQIKIKKPVDWPDKFLKSLEPHHRNVSKALRKVHETLQKNILAPVALNIADIVTGVPISDVVISLVQLLEPDELEKLYGELGLEPATIKKAGKEAGRTVAQKAKFLLEPLWKEKTFDNMLDSILRTLDKCDNKEAKEKFEALWHKVTTSDVSDVIELLAGCNKDKFYSELDLSTSQIREIEADTNHNERSVLEYWCQTNDQQATRRALLEALRMSGDTDAKAELEKRWIRKDMASDSDFRDVCKKLGPDQMKHLYTELWLSSQDIDRKETDADTTDTHLKAKTVLQFWRRVNGQAANRTAILAALERCRFNKAKEELAAMWNIKDILHSKDASCGGGEEASSDSEYESAESEYESCTSELES